MDVVAVVEILFETAEIVYFEPPVWIGHLRQMACVGAYGVYLKVVDRREARHFHFGHHYRAVALAVMCRGAHHHTQTDEQHQRKQESEGLDKAETASGFAPADVLVHREVRVRVAAVRKSVIIKDNAGEFEGFATFHTGAALAAVVFAAFVAGICVRIVDA